MKHKLIICLTVILVLLVQLLPAQPIADGKINSTVKIYYFHPSERCPIDQSIEENTRKLVTAAFSKEIREGSLVFRVINTDDPSNASLVSKFEINAQALYVVKNIKGKEIHSDLTEFAFSTSLSEPVKFREELLNEVSEALKSL